ncbi:helix-turn-helix transcriptional regulator [Lacticaseibacillus rhamnosus]|uniref:helix-turn-helix domain-containing protein n=1 Tax=Lacticaseibacillus rhamnosus TaxID=47715 RepID=UPI0018A0221A|nr:helix-turn-helix transcriptional regulator [Lacticaseibacillus rhamnosus]
MILSGEQIKQLRNARRMSQVDLSRATGLSASLISSYEAGTRNVTQEASDKIAIAFNDITPINPAERTQTADLDDDKTLVKMNGIPLMPAEKALLKALAKAMLDQRK